jgi:hypothetical protein
MTNDEQDEVILDELYHEEQTPKPRLLAELTAQQQFRLEKKAYREI